LKAIAVNGNGTQRANDDTEDERPARGATRKDANGDVNMEDDELDEAEKEVLGLVSGDEDEAAEDLDEVEKELLGLGADETEEEASEGGMDVDNDL
jgi:Ino eighty subunit 1